LRHPRQPEILVLQCAGDGGESALHALFALKISSDDCGLEFSSGKSDDKFRHVLCAGDVLVWDARRTICQASCNGDAGNTLYRIAVAEHV
jgi:hypothetical protein